MFVRIHIHIIYAFCNTTALKLQRIHGLIADAVELDIDVLCQLHLFVVMF